MNIVNEKRMLNGYRSTIQKKNTSRVDIYFSRVVLSNKKLYHHTGQSLSFKQIVINPWTILNELDR